MPEIRTVTEIDAPVGVAWSVLSDFKRYPEWNPFLIRVDGEPAVGAPVVLRVSTPPIKVTFHVKVLVAAVDREIRWKGNFLSDGVMAGEHYFTLEPIGPSRVRFIHGEIFTGVVSSAVWPLMAPGTRRGYAAMNNAFKKRVEELALQKAS